MNTVSVSFFEGRTEDVARRLLGAVLLHESREGIAAGRIVETEAYLHDDPAAHSFRGKTQRNASMFLGAGHAYVYLIYGVHHCFNVVTNDAGVGEAVLVRALEPVEGIELMAQRRGTDVVRQLCSGPGKLVQALGITREHDGVSLLCPELRICEPTTRSSEPIVSAKRIGITKAAEEELRFYLKGNPHVSRQ